jgi:uncharacterized membrane protein HdeD (DUF308 family)
MAVHPIVGRTLLISGHIYRGGMPGHAVLMNIDSPERSDELSPMERLARRGWQFVLGLGIVSVVLGIIVLVWPDQTLRVVGVLFGIYLLVSGVTEIIVAFAPGFRSGWSRFFSAVAGALSIFLGLISFRGAAEQIFLLALWIGFGWLFTGIARAVSAGSMPYLPFRGWQIFGGILLALAGVIVILAPFKSIFALALVAGIWLIVIGIWGIIEAFMARKHAKLIGLT